jgi:hypothetical protein
MSQRMLNLMDWLERNAEELIEAKNPYFTDAGARQYAWRAIHWRGDPIPAEWSKPEMDDLMRILSNWGEKYYEYRENQERLETLRSLE